MPIYMHPTLFQEADLLVVYDGSPCSWGPKPLWSCDPWPSLGTPIFARSAGDGRALMRMFGKGLVRSLLACGRGSKF